MTLIFSNIQKQLSQYSADSDPEKFAQAKPIQKWIEREKLQLELDQDGDGEPIENYSFEQEEAEYQAEAYDDEAHYIVRTNPYRISVQSPGEPLQKARWRSLKRVTIEISDQGPIEMDIWISILTDDGNCRFPDGAQGSQEVVDQLFKLEDFDHEMFIKAMGCVENTEFVVYPKN